MKKVVFSLLILFIILPPDSSAQCAMCGAVAETSSQSGTTSATGLNSGIVYLMAFPYLLMGAIGYAIYRHKKQKAV